MPSAARTVVVLPEPLLPRKPKVSPRRMSNDRSRITVVRPKSMRKFAMWTRGSAVVIVVVGVGSLIVASLGGGGDIRLLTCRGPARILFNRTVDKETSWI